MTPAKPQRRWLAHHRDGCVTVCVHAATWFLARQAAAVLLRADPDEIDVRPG